MPTKANYSKFFSVYLSQHVEKNTTGEIRLDCPFVDCPNCSDHFYCNTDTGMWNCKRCEVSGNPQNLITLIHQQFLEETTESQLQSLSEMRGISVETLRKAGFAYDYTEDRWLVPYYSYLHKEQTWSPFLNNLGYFYPSSTNEKSRFKIKKATALPLQLYNPGIHVDNPSEEGKLLEGEWDTLAYYDICGDDVQAIGKPGSGLTTSQIKYLSNIRKLTTMLDNDSSGQKQTTMCLQKLEKVIPEIKVLDWSLVPNPPKDVRDLKIRAPKTALEQLDDAEVTYDNDFEEENVEETKQLYTTNIEDYPEVRSFDQYIETVKSAKMYLATETPKAMAATLAIANSISIDGEPLWAFLIGPPSCGKTMFIDSFGGNNELFDNLSKLTAKSLVSGWKDETGDEPSYLARLKDKTLFVKDFTVTLSESADLQRELFGLLTDIYDGYVKIAYGHNLIREFKASFNMVAGVTDKVHAHSSATIGERFLRIDYLGKEYNARKFATSALQSFGKKKDKEETLIKNTLGFIRYLKNRPLVQELQDEYIEGITDLAEFIATIRTKVEVDRKDGIKYRPRAELPARLALQLAKMFVSSRSVFVDDPNKEEHIQLSSVPAFEVTKKVAMDTCHGFAMDLVSTLLKHPGSDRTELAKRANIHEQKAYRVITELLTTGVITKTSGNVSSRGGRPKHYYSIEPKLVKVLAGNDTITKTTERKRRNNPPKRPKRHRKL